MDPAGYPRGGHQKAVVRLGARGVALPGQSRRALLAGLCEGLRAMPRGGGGVKVWRVRLPETSRSLTRGKFLRFGKLLTLFC